MEKIWLIDLKNRLVRIEGNASTKIVSVLITEMPPLPLIMNAIDGTNRSVSFFEIIRTR